MPRYSPRTGLLTTYQVGPFDSTHIYVQWGGKLPGNEQWSCGFRMWKSGGSVPEDTGILAGIGTALVEFHSSPSAYLSAAAKLSFVKVNAVGLDGKYQSESTTQAFYSDVAGGSPSGTYPNQIALAASLETGFTRGPAHAGRFFLPLPVHPVDGNGVISAGIAGSTEDALNTMRTAVNAAGGGHVMVVMSRKAGAPGHRAVTGFKVGRVLDTQRRRRRSLLEQYVG